MSNDMKFKDMEEHLDEVSEYRSFNIRYNNTNPNKAFHKAFIDFCWAEVDGNYLQGIKKLLENYGDDFRYSSLHASLQDLKGSVIELQKVPDVEDDDKEDGGFF